MTETPKTTPWTPGRMRYEMDYSGSQGKPVLIAADVVVATINPGLENARLNAEHIMELWNLSIDDPAAFMAAVDALVKASSEAEQWLARFGEHSPIAFGGEGDVWEHLFDALAAVRAARGEVRS